MVNKFKYDIFLSHSSKDKSVVRELALRLRADGFRVWFEETEISAGDLIGHKIEQALQQSRTLVLCMSRHAFASEWVTLERHTALFRDPANSTRRFVPLRLDDADLADTLRQFAYVDWRLQSESEYARLRAACARPSQEEVLETQIESTILTGHNGAVWRVAVTPDGRWATSGSEDTTVWLWDLHRGRRIAAMRGHVDAVNAVAITADGRRIVSGDDRGLVLVWEAASGNCIFELSNPGPLASYGLALINGGTRALCISGSIARLWDLESGKNLGEIDIEYGSGLALAPDGRRFLVGAQRSVHVWDLESGELIASLEGHTDDVSAVAITTDGRRAVSTSVDATIRVWDLDVFRCRATLEGHTDEVSGIAVTPDGRRAVSGSADRTVRVWNLASGRQRRPSVDPPRGAILIHGAGRSGAGAALL